MFLAVWLVYAADRLLDTKTLTDHRPAHELQPRHRFPRAHLRPFAAAMLLAAIAIAALVPNLPKSLLAPYLCLAALLAFWFALIHLTPITLPKELVPGVFFAAAVFLPSRPSELLPPILFAALCTLNCLYIHAWEHPPPPKVRPPQPTLTRSHLPLTRGHLDRSRSVSPSDAVDYRHCHLIERTQDVPRYPSRPPNFALAHPATTLALRHLPKLTFTLAILALLRPTPISLAVSLAALTLFTLDHYRPHLPPTTLRAAADLALLTPLLVLPFLP